MPSEVEFDHRFDGLLTWARNASVSTPSGSNSRVDGFSTSRDMADGGTPEVKCYSEFVAAESDGGGAGK